MYVHAWTHTYVLCVPVPFRQDTMAKFTPKTPDILNKIRLPDLDFVDVYNQPAAPDDYVDLEQDATFDAVKSNDHDY